MGIGEATLARQESDYVMTSTPNWVEINAIRIPNSVERGSNETRVSVTAEPMADEGRIAASEPRANEGRKKLFVVIVAGFRTGSTLLGEFFNKNNEMFYLFEPLHQVRALLFIFLTSCKLVSFKYLRLRCIVAHK